ncbi:asparagine synthase-related protein [Streptomyces stramineus]
MFVGYPQFRKDLSLSLSTTARARAAKGYAALAAQGLPLPAADPGHPGLPAQLDRRTPPGRHPARHRPAAAGVRRRTRRRRQRRAAAGRRRRPARRAGPVHQSTYLFAKSWLPGYILAAERLDSAQAVEVRLPLFDHHLFATVRTTPLAWYDKDGSGKYPLRAALRDRLPDEVARGPSGPSSPLPRSATPPCSPPCATSPKARPPGTAPSSTRTPYAPSSTGSPQRPRPQDGRRTAAATRRGHRRPGRRLRPGRPRPAGRRSP